MYSSVTKKCTFCLNVFQCAAVDPPAPGSKTSAKYCVKDQKCAALFLLILGRLWCVMYHSCVMLLLQKYLAVNRWPYSPLTAVPYRK